MAEAVTDRRVSDYNTVKPDYHAVALPAQEAIKLLEQSSSKEVLDQSFAPPDKNVHRSD